jgi:cell shape-determining protein MreD
VELVRFVMLFFWTFLLTHMAGYLIASMNGAAYEAVTTSIIAGVAFVFIIIVGELLPVTKETNHQ